MRNTSTLAKCYGRTNFPCKYMRLSSTTEIFHNNAMTMRKSRKRTHALSTILRTIFIRSRRTYVFHRPVIAARQRTGRWMSPPSKGGTIEAMKRWLFESLFQIRGNTMHKTLTALAIAATITVAAVAAPQQAEARGGAIAAGIIGGIAAGAIIGSAPSRRPRPGRRDRWDRRAPSGG